jgi:N-methylhydantoinase A
MKIILGVDTGGTFTDFVLYRDGTITTHKVLSTPHAPEQAILQGVAELGLHQAGIDTLYIVHGSTVATNAVLEGKGVRTAFITNHGLRDLLTIGRQTRRELYNLQPHPPPIPVARELCLETGGRLGADGSVIEPLSDTDLDVLCNTLETLAPQAVAINLLFSYLDPQFEERIEAALGEHYFVSRSSSVLPEFREYERGITTWLNAYVGPLVAGYLSRLQQGIPRATVSVMQSSGGTIAAEQAGRQAVHMLLSGPAGGLAAARFLGQQVQRSRLLTFDMGGTSTDVAMVAGDLQLTSEGQIAGYPVAIPMVDMHTIGAGGGSIAFLDRGGMLQVGPESAGATPGPACYGLGGSRPTVTDANLILGRLRGDAFLGGEMLLDIAAAREAMQSVAAPLGLSLEQAAEGVIRIANEHMSHALRVISVQRGIDPRILTLVSFGGAGGLHVCALAESLGMQLAMVPMHAGVLSALGMLVAPRSRQLSRTHIVRLTDLELTQIVTVLAELEEQGRVELRAEGVADADIEMQPSLDLRYEGQSYYLNVSWDHDLAASEEAFHHFHMERYGHELSLPVELVNVRLGLRAAVTAMKLRSLAQAPPGCPYDTISLYGVAQAAGVFARQDLVSGQKLCGPALITETVSTTYLAPGWHCEVDAIGNLLLHQAGD